MTSWQHQVHPGDPSKRVFARDLLQVGVLNESRSKRLFTLFNNHLTSQFVAFGEDPIAAPAAKATRRRRQCETIARIVEAELRPDSPFLIVGDMNDTPDSEALQPLVQAPLCCGGLDGKRSWLPPSYELFDQIWLSPALQDNLSESWIDRRTKHSGDGSDHDPAWVILDL